MRARLSGRVIDSFPAWREKDVRLVSPRAAVEAWVLDDAEATRANNRSRIIAACVGAAFIATMAIAALTLDVGPERANILTALIPVLIGFPIVLAFVTHWSQARWLDSLVTRRKGSPPPRTPIRLDAAGLSIGERGMAWPELSVTDIELAEPTSEYIYVMRLTLRAADFEAVLDRELIRDGAPLIDELYRRLCRPLARKLRER